MVPRAPRCAVCGHGRPRHHRGEEGCRRPLPAVSDDDGSTCATELVISSVGAIPREPKVSRGGEKFRPSASLAATKWLEWDEPWPSGRGGPRGQDRDTQPDWVSPRSAFPSQQSALARSGAVAVWLGWAPRPQSSGSRALRPSRGLNQGNLRTGSRPAGHREEGRPGPGRGTGAGASPEPRQAEAGSKVPH